ncbi:acyloxyacyl hydrolase [Pelagibacteraceae bacterium]|nr:acyloxyacyl hydrolase [Pelagibacteraceae bacterium]MDC0412754.1 acyloxyacyl hydrolase [Pelagibacteraceae bacterium]
MRYIIKFFVFLVLVAGTKVHAGELKTSLFQFDSDNADQQAVSLDLNYNFDRSYETVIGEVKPLVGAFMTEYYAAMVYAGAKIDYKIGRLVITPSFAPGLYSYGSDKRGSYDANRTPTKQGYSKPLGQILEFKSQIDIGFDASSFGIFSLGLSHISNGDLSEYNPGVNNFHLSFVNQF